MIWSKIYQCAIQTIYVVFELEFGLPFTFFGQWDGWNASISLVIGLMYEKEFFRPKKTKWVLPLKLKTWVRGSLNPNIWFFRFCFCFCFFVIFYLLCLSHVSFVLGQTVNFHIITVYTFVLSSIKFLFLYTSTYSNSLSFINCIFDYPYISLCIVLHSLWSLYSFCHFCHLIDVIHAMFVIFVIFCHIC